VKLVLYALAPERIILGGSVSRSWEHFSASLEDSLGDFAYPSVVRALKIKVSHQEHVAILGAATLFVNQTG
jgi:glucokinase